MIVKNEERVLGRCLDSIKDIADEIVIVDTGSTDKTKEIAAGYTDRIYDFAWTGSFSDARNFAFSKTTCDYIYSADADEVIDERNLRKFKELKAVLMSEIEIVQMIYVNPASINMAYNNLRELRPKLFKRLRPFVWIDPIHETVRTEPLVYDSDIEILHLPEENHAKRDFSAFLRVLGKDKTMSDRLFSMYAKELFFNGEASDFKAAEPYFEKRITGEETYENYEAYAVNLRSAFENGETERIKKADEEFESLGFKPAEICYTLGLYHEKAGNTRMAEKYFMLSKSAESIICEKYKAK